MIPCRDLKSTIFIGMVFMSPPVRMHHMFFSPPSTPRFNVGRYGVLRCSFPKNGTFFISPGDAPEYANNIEVGGKRGLHSLVNAVRIGDIT